MAANPSSSERDPQREAQRLARKDRRHAQRRSAILEAARRLLVEEGIENFTVSAVAAVAEVSKPAVYYYFDSKEELVGALARQVLRAELEAWDEAIGSAATGWDATVAVLRCHVAHYAADLDSFRILYVWPQVLGICQRIAEADANTRRANLIETLVSRLRQDQSSGRLHAATQPRSLVAMALATAHGLLCSQCGAQAATLTGGIQVAALCDAACDALRRAAAPT